MPTAVIYARYSSHAQRDASIDQQLATCRAFAQRGGIDIVDVYTDRALTGTNDNRPGFKKMISDASKGRWNYVLVYALDRFSRDRYDSAVNKKRLRDCGVKVISATEPITEDPVGSLMESMLEGYAEYYSRELSAKVRRGHADNAKKGIVNGPLPLGYRRGTDGRPEIDPDRAEIVREIYRRAGQGEPLVRIAEDLNARGIRTKTGGPWGKSSFNTLLSNERYTGLYIYQDTRIPGGIPAIISPEDFAAVQHRLGDKKNPRRPVLPDAPPSRRRGADIYLLTGKLFCAGCGAPLVGVSGKARDGSLRHYYACRGRIREGRQCGLKNIRRDDIEADIAAAIKQRILNEPTIQAISEAAYTYQLSLCESADLTILRQQLADTTKALKNIMAAIEQGIFTASTKTRLQELEADQQSLTARITAAEAAVENIPTKSEIAATLKYYATGDLADPLYREALIDTFLVRAYVHPDHYDIYFSTDAKSAVSFPLDLKTATLSEPELLNGSYSVPGLGPDQTIRTVTQHIISICGMFRITFNRPSH